MRLDHLSYAAGPEGIAQTSRRLSGLLGEEFVDGGVHPRFGTRNKVLPLEGGVYLEVVGVLDHPASEKAAFGQVVRARTEAGGGWLGWVVAVDDMSVVERRLGHAAVHGSRHRPDGFELRWQQLGVSGLQAEPQLPFFVRWEIQPQEHPSCGASGAIRLSRLEIAGDPTRVSEWLDQDPAKPLEDVDVEWVQADGTSGIVAATFDTPGGPVRF
jgi:Glyoxalase-like domain